MDKKLVIRLSRDAELSDFQHLFPEDDVAVFNGEKEVDLLIFPGGADVNPAKYGQRNQGSCVDPHSDEVDFKLWDMYVEDEVTAHKVLGICRGLQFLNVAQGGTLYQDLATNGRKNEQIHPIYWNKPYNEVLKKISVVNSFHHQAIRTLPYGARDVRTLGTNPNTATLEAVAFSNAIIGFQFHPEYIGNTHPTYIYFQKAIRDWVLGKLDMMTGKYIKEVNPDAKPKLPEPEEVREVVEANIYFEEWED